MTACLKIIGCCKPQRLRHRGSCFSEVGRFRQWFPILTSPDLWMRPFSHLLYVYWSWFIPRLCRRFSRGPFFFFFRWKGHTSATRHSACVKKNWSAQNEKLSMMAESKCSDFPQQQQQDKQKRRGKKGELAFRNTVNVLYNRDVNTFKLCSVGAQ